MRKGVPQSFPETIADTLGIKSTDVTVTNDSGEISVQIAHEITTEQQRQLDNLLDPDSELKAIKAATRMSVKVDELTPDQIREIELIFDEWGPGMVVTVGEYYRHKGRLYKVIKLPTTQAEPQTAPNYFIPVWRQPDEGNAYNAGDKAIYKGDTHESIVDGNTSPPEDSGKWKKP